jgi:hypothetical protein
MINDNLDAARSEEQRRALSLLDMAQKTHDELLSSAQKQQEEILTAAREEAERLVFEAELYKEQTLETSSAKAEELVSNAEIEAASIVNSTQAKRDDLQLEIAKLVALEAGYRDRLSDVFASHAESFGFTLIPLGYRNDSEIELPSVDDVDAGPVIVDPVAPVGTEYEGTEGETVTVDDVEEVVTEEDFVAAIAETLNSVHVELESTRVDNDDTDQEGTESAGDRTEDETEQAPQQ